MLEHGALHVVCGEKKKLEDQKKNSLPSVKRTTLGKDVRLCRVSPARRSAKITHLPSVVALTLGKGLSLCRVPRSLHSAKLQNFFSFFFSFILSMHIHSQITYIHIYIHRSHIYHKFSHIHHIYHKSPHKSTSPSSIHPQIHIKFTSTSHKFTNDTYPHKVDKVHPSITHIHKSIHPSTSPSSPQSPTSTSAQVMYL